MHGVRQGIVLSFTTSQQQKQIGNAPAVLTKSASSVRQTSALLNSSTNPRGFLSNSWFEWGRTVALNNKTGRLPMGSGNVFRDYSFPLTGLSPNTIYYYRVVAQNLYGITYGSILSFNTQSIQIIIPPIIIPPKPIEPEIIIEAPEALSLLVAASIDKDDVAPGEKFNYTLAYKNIAAEPVTNVIIAISFPEEIDYQGKTIFEFDKIKAGEHGTIEIAASVKELVLAKEKDLIIVAVIEYIDIDNTVQLFNVELPIIVRSEVVEISLMASLINAIGSFLIKIGNWFFGLLFLALVIIISWYYFIRKRKKVA